VALEEEMQAESAWATAAAGGALREVAPATLPAGGGAARMPGGAGGDALRPEEAQGLFTPDAVAHLKLALLTGVDPAAKIEAVRKLAYAPLDAEEKGRLCLRALAEDHPGVRREAALLLRTLGIAPEVSETIAGLSEGEPRARKLAMAHVAALQARVTPAEQLILLAVLLAVIREEKDAGLVAEALGALAALGPRAVVDRELLDRVLRQILPLLAGDVSLAEPATGTLLALGRAGPAALGETLWPEAQAAKDDPLRRRLLLVLARLPAAAGAFSRRDLAGAIARELGRGTDSDALCRQLAVDVIALGADAVDALVEAFPSARAEQWPFLVKVIDDVATVEGVPAAVREPVGSFFLRTWRNGGRILRLAILSTRLPVDRALPAELRRDFARCFLADLHDAGFPHVAEATETAIRDMGVDVLPVVRAAATESVHPAEREAAVRLYAGILRDAQDGASPTVGAPALSEAAAFLRGLGDAADVAPGVAARALGVLLSGPLAPPELVAEVTADFRRRLVRTAAAGDMICALGWIASGPRADAALRVDLFVLVIELLMRATADAPVTQTRTDEGVRLEFSPDASRQSDFIRELILAARRIVVSSGSRPGLPPGLRERAVRRLLEKWGSVSIYDVVWAPGNVTELAEALGEIATAPGLPVTLRVDVLGGLLRSARSIPVIRILGRACAWEGDDGAPPAPEAASTFGARCREVGDRFAGMIQHADYADPEDQDVLLEAIGRLAGGAHLGATPAEADVVRRRLVTCLFDGLTHGHRRARETLQSLVASPRLPEPLRAEIRERLEGIRGQGKV
jgi:hypothetical protein